MANRQTTFLLKRSNVPGKIPSSSGLTLGELALNTADAILYTSGTTANNILPIGWDRIHRTGDTVTGDFVFNGNIDVTSISPIDYIDFNTTPTVPNPTGGTIYFDANENALSYKPITNQNDVTVNLGQESLIRIYNDLPTTILNGQVLHITGATGAIPTVALANASKLGTAFTESLAQTSGVATHDIDPGDFGFMTNFGIVRDLNTSAFTVGSEVFLSDTVDGALTNDPNSIEFTSRISTVGYCLESHPTTGKILVVISNENPLQSLTQQEINVLLGNTISTGAYDYTGMTKASSTTVNVAPMRGWIVFNTDERATNPLVLNVYYSGGTNIPVTNINSSLDTYFLVNSGGTLFQQTTFPTPVERRDNIFLGRAVHPNKTDILNVEQSVDYDVSPLSSLRDLWTPIRLINQGVIISNNGANLTFKTSSGTFWGNGIGWDTNQKNPNSITVPAQIPAVFYYTTQTGGTFTTTASTIDTTSYDVNGIITPIPGTGNYSTQRIYMSQSGVIRIQYGQVFYPTLAKAIAALPSELFVENADNAIDCILIGTLTVKDGATDLSNIDDAVFSLVSKFGEVLGGTAGISTTTLQQAYNNSVNPEITTDSVLGGVQFKGGTGSNTDKNIIIENNSSVETAFIRADGFISGSSLNAPNLIISGGTQSIFSGNTSTDLLRVTQTGSGNAFVVEDESNPDSTPFRIDTSGNTAIGVTTSPLSFKLEVNGTSMFRNNMNLNQALLSEVYTYNSVTDSNKINLTVGRFHDHNDGAVDVGYTSQFRWDKRQSSNISLARSIDIPVNFTSGSSGAVGQFNSINTNLQIVEGSTITTPFTAHFIEATKGTTGTVTSFTGIDVNDNSVSNTIYGFRSRLTLGTGKYGLYFDGTANNYLNGNVGIGTSTPTATLQVSGTTLLQSISGTSLDISGNSSSDLVKITQTGSGNAFVVEDSIRPDSSPFVIDASGNVGIGTTSPSSALNIKTIINSNVGNPGLRVSGSVNYIGMQYDEDLGPVFYTNYVGANNSFLFKGSTYQNLAAIGTNGIFSWNTNGKISNFNSNGYINLWNGISGDMEVVVATNNGIKFLTNNIERVIISNTGNVGIGTSTPREKLDVSGNTIVSGTLSGGTMAITTQPTSGYTTTQILMRNSTSGQVEITDSTSPSIYNYGMSYAMSTFNYLT